MNMLASMSLPQWMLSAFLIFVCLILMLVVLVQRGRGQGLAGAFGGGGGGGGAFGAKTGDVFTWITVVIATLFLLLNVVGNFVLDQTPEAPKTADTTVVPTTDLPVTGDDTGDVKASIKLMGKSVGTDEPIEIDLEGLSETTGVAPAGEDAAPAPKPQEKPADTAAPKSADDSTPGDKG